jgi:hypothetical protein
MTPSPITPSQQHIALLNEYDGLLVRLNSVKETSSEIEGCYYIPASNTPLHRVHMDALSSLAQLMKNPIYLATLAQRKLNARRMEVTIEGQRTTYETTRIGGGHAYLEPEEFPQLRGLFSAVERGNRALGGNLRADAMLPICIALSFYGVPPALFKQLDALILYVEEARAIHRLRLGTVADINSLFQPDEHKYVVAAVENIVAKNETSAIDSLVRQALPDATVEQVRASPMRSLDRLLNCPKAQALAEDLVQWLNWYGAKADEQPPPDISPHLVAEALRLWYSSSHGHQPGTLVGFDLNSREHRGKSYQTLRRDFEKHLSEYAIVRETEAETLEQVLVGHLLLSKYSSDFAVPDVPPDLPYASSIAWVNFVHGVNLAQALEPGLLHRLSFQQLIDLPLRQSENASNELMQLIALTRAEPAQRWAAAAALGDLTVVSITEALSTLDNSTQELSQAISQLNAQPEPRLDIAKAEIARGFPLNKMPKGLRLAKAVTGRSKRAVIILPDIKASAYEFAEVYAGGGFKHGQKWSVILDGIPRQNWIVLSSDNRVETDEKWRTFRTSGLPAFYSEFLPDIELTFNQRFEGYVADSKKAYACLIRHLLISLPWDEREALAQGEVRIHSLNQILNEMSSLTTGEEIPPSRQARLGFLLEAKPIEGDSRFYECLPRAGIIRRRHDITAEHLGPAIRKTLIFKDMGPLNARTNKQLPLDWQAYHQGTVPLEDATCRAFISRLGSLPAPPAAHSIHSGLILNSPRTQKIAALVAEVLFYYNVDELRSVAWGETAFDRDKAAGHWLESIKPFVPFWGGIDDLKSDDFGTRLLGVAGLVVDVLSFAVPLGKFAAGSIRLAATASRIGIRSALPAFSKVSGKLLNATLKNLNPLAVVSASLKLSRQSLLLTGRVLYRAGRSSLTGVRTLIATTAHYDLVKGITQVTDPGAWKPLAQGDDLATFKGINDVPVRSIATPAGNRYFLIEPLSLKPYGPRLLMTSTELSPGRSTYNSVGNADGHSLIEISQQSRVRELLEADGRTTLLIDDVAYRLDGDVLRRADLIDDSQRVKMLPCRVRRAPGNEVCETRYVTRDPAPTPAPGSFDDSKGWATWFGDSIYIPAAGHAPLRAADIGQHTRLNATMTFQKGMYGRVCVNLPRPGGSLTDTFQVGATISQDMHDSTQLVFMRLNAGGFYVAELAKGQSLKDPLLFKQAATLSAQLRQELTTVYIGSLNANNIARIYGITAVERAMKAMDKIAVPIGGHSNPPDTLRRIKVDTSPGEAVLFDHSTRMIVRHSSDGAATWSLSRAAPDSARETTARVFNALFEKTVITFDAKAANAKALKIDNTMQQLQLLISQKTRKKLHSPRNIAFAEITTQTGSREVYVSVSGQQGDTAFLPLFARHPDNPQVTLGNITYFNIDHDHRFAATSLNVSAAGKIRAIPHTIDNIETYTPALTSRPTSLDTESKLIRVIREKYPDAKKLNSITIATTMAPCDSCAVVMKQFGYDGSPDAMNVLWK